jgi:hypothetical protein
MQEKRLPAAACNIKFGIGQSYRPLFQPLGRVSQKPWIPTQQNKSPCLLEAFLLSRIQIQKHVIEYP